MPVKIETQKDYLLTEVSVQLPCDLNDLDFLMRSSHATGKIIAQYCDGGLLGVNIEQRSKIREGVSAKVRELIGVRTKEMNGHD